MTKIILALCLLLSVPAGHATAQVRRALVIGLGQQQDKSWSKINGDRDVAPVTAMLKRAGYRHIRTLTNAQATKAAIKSAFAGLEADCRPGDIVYIHFSGHGQQMTDADGDEADGWDECWIPYDAYMAYCANDRGDKHLADDELNAMLTALADRITGSGKMLVVVDACHSGDSSRDGGNDTYRGTADKFTLPGRRGARRRPRSGRRWITLSACKDYQRNAELKTKDGNYGKLTCAIVGIAGTGGSMANDRLYAQIEAFFGKHRGALPQTPVMEGATGTFRITDIIK